VRGPGSTNYLLRGVVGLLAGSLGGVLATGAMYGVAAVVLAATGVPLGRWAAATETGFGGTVGSLLDLAGLPLHLLHGVVIGALVGAALLLFMPALRARVGVAGGLLLGLVLWVGVLVLSTATRATQGDGPPIVLSLTMHLAFGWVLTSTGLAVGRWAVPSLTAVPKE